jgi:mannosyltransferase
VVAAGDRFATLGVQSFDFDESFTVGVVVNGSLGHVLHWIPLTESSPPLYYVLAWLWSKLFGLSEPGIRSLSAVLGTAVAPVAFMIGRRLGSHRAGVIAGLLVALNPLLVWYSQEARTYALLALLGALSFWSFLSALERPDGRRMAVWAAVSAAAVLSHYFAAFLVIVEAAWLIVATRRRSALIASGAVALVGAALIPLVLRQADHRSDWIANLSFASRVKEVTKKLVTGELTPANDVQLAAVLLLAGGAMVYAARRLSQREQRGAALALGVGCGAIALPMIVDVFGFRYLISKNVIAAVPVLLVGAAVILGAQRAPRVGTAGAAAGLTLFAALVVDGALNPALQRPDYRTAAKALGSPVRDEVVLAPNLGNMPLALYRPGSAPMPSGGWPTRQVVIVWPVSQENSPNGRPPTPSAPAGFTFEGRMNARTFSLICYGSPVPRVATPAPLLALVADKPPTAQVWPQAHATSAGRSACAPAA